MRLRHHLALASTLVFAVLPIIGAPVADAQPAAPSAAAPTPVAAPAVVTPPPARATVLHVPRATAIAGAPLELVAAVDAAWAEPLLVARYRAVGATGWQEVAFRHSSTGGWFATVPASAINPPGAEYYIVGRGPAGEQPHFASDAAPHLVRIEPTEDERLADADRVRNEGRTDTVRLDVDAHDFGNRFGNQDRYLRGELEWTHRFSRRLYSIGFGFGFIQGQTPREDPDDGSANHAARYGAATVRLRLHPSIYTDLRLILGVSHEGFMRGGAGTVTFGKPWRSNFAVGAEVLDDLGPSLSVRLQWDTVPKMLMGAAIVRTELPGTLISSSGLYLKYDVSYQLVGGHAVRAAMTYGTRDGAGRFGGGLGVATSF
jgi:hypothetical protein